MTFQEHCREAVRELRGALLDLYVQIGADPDKPQEVSRNLGLNKNLTWKISRVIQAEDAFAALPLLPGLAGLELVLDAAAKAGASEGSLTRARTSIASIEAMVEIHGGDRTMMDLMLDSMGGAGLAKSRKLAFRGNAGIWGVLAKARVSTQVLAPNADDPDMLDLVLVVGLQQVRRFRSIPRWPVFQLGRFEFDDSAQRFSIEDAPGAPEGLMTSFTRGAMPEIYTKRESDGLVYEIGDGPVGKTGEFGCYFSFGHRADVPRYSTKPNDTAWLGAAVSMPVETLVVDLLVHKDIPEALMAETSVYGGAWVGAPEFPDSNRLPIHERLIHLGRRADLSTPVADQYASVMHVVFERAGWSPEDFHCMRMIVEHPPMPSRVVLRYPLQERGR